MVSSMLQISERLFNKIPESMVLFIARFAIAGRLLAVRTNEN